MAGEMLPSLELIMKDKDGNPIDVEDAIIYRDGEELKVWEAVLEYAAAQPKDAQGNPHTAHTANPVPLTVAWSGVKAVGIGALCDIAPTVLDLLGIKQPSEMTGKSLIKE